MKRRRLRYLRPDCFDYLGLAVECADHLSNFLQLYFINQVDFIEHNNRSELNLTSLKQSYFIIIIVEEYEG